MTWLFEDIVSGNALKLDTTESATGFCVTDRSGIEAETVCLNLEKLKSLRKAIDLEVERLTPKTRRFCGNKEPHNQHLYNAPGPKSSYQFDCLGY